MVRRILLLTLSLIISLLYTNIFFQCYTGLLLSPDDTLKNILAIILISDIPVMLSSTLISVYLVVALIKQYIDILQRRK